MAMLAEVVDAVIGVDTHRDTNQVEITRPSGAVIATAHSVTTAPATPRRWPGSSTMPRVHG
jgi:hypothetical protein